MSKKYTIYNKDFKEKIVQECIESKNYHSVARKYELPPTTVYDWFNSYKNKTVNEQKKKDKNLSKKLEDALLENEILKELLKKTNQIWLKE